MQEISAKDVRWQLTDVLNEASFKGVRFLITRHGHPVAVLIGVEDYEQLASSPGHEASELQLKEMRATVERRSAPNKRRSKRTQQHEFARII